MEFFLFILFLMEKVLFTQNSASYIYSTHIYIRIYIAIISIIIIITTDIK